MIVLNFPIILAAKKQQSKKNQIRRVKIKTTLFLPKLNYVLLTIKSSVKIYENLNHLIKELFMSLINFQSELEQNYSGKKCTIYLILNIFLKLQIKALINKRKFCIKVCQLSQVLLLNNMTL